MQELIRLASYITPSTKMFDDWLDDCLERAIKLFPSQYDRLYINRNEKEFKNKIYNSSNEPLIPREFWWESNFDFDTADNDSLLKNFIENIDYESRLDIFKSPKEILNAGFIGTPYTWEKGMKSQPFIFDEKYTFLEIKK